ALTFERGVELMEAKLAGVRQNILKEFSGSEIQILAGRYGPYITDGAKNANVPKEKEPADITLEEATALLAAAPERKGGKKPRRGAAAKAAPKAKTKAAPTAKRKKKA
ncbi:MAG TPA: topoisomerase C-terminal repeat-containing protein, partial [Flavobacteriales bacterium]|nr:topoisomerase C-terminal repeat-containing protein [Flavobacteriales bacterium]